jgi:hypothetical protein
MMNRLIAFLISLSLPAIMQAAPITISTPQVEAGDLIRSEDWNRIKVDLESLAIGLDIVTNQSWLPNGSNVYYNIGNVGIGTNLPQSSLDIFKQSPVPNWKLIQAGTDTDAERFVVEQDGDVLMDGNMLVRGGNIYDSDGNLTLSGEENLYLVTDWDNDANNTTSVIFGKNNAGPGAAFEEMMRVTESGLVGIATPSPFQTWSAEPPAGIELFGAGAQLGLSEAGGDRWAWQIGSTGLELVNDATSVMPVLINSSGQVGINQPAPQRDLHIGGTARFDSAIETNLWCNQTGSGCISQLLVQSLLSSGSGPQSCPSGFTMVGGVGQSNSFCFETNERVSTDFWNAKQICSGLNDSILGRARLCSATHWYDACNTSSGNALTGNDEWVDQVDANDEALAYGALACETVSRFDVSTDNPFRCCY